jgi:hypothetical protein
MRESWPPFSSPPKDWPAGARRNDLRK